MSRFYAVCLLLALLCQVYGDVSPASCTTDGTVPAPNATNCADSRDSTECAALFPQTAGPPAARDTKCTDPTLKDLALECANTCMLCCETAAFTCGDDPAAPINCTANARYCKDANWTAVMQKYCPGTCGLCQAAGGCSDVLTGCKDMITLCNDVTYQPYMREKCQRTCNFCPSSGTPTSAPGACADVATNCAENTALCTNAAYYDLMTQKCPSTCGRCSGGGGGSTCTDSSADCATWVGNGFCTNSFYTDAQKVQYCGRSCNLC